MGNPNVLPVPIECVFPEAKLMADDLIKLLERLKERFRNEKETGD
jgi:hypothetical protein